MGLTFWWNLNDFDQHDMNLCFFYLLRNSNSWYKPGPSMNITNLSNKLLNGLVSEHIFSNTKQLRSLLLLNLISSLGRTTYVGIWAKATQCENQRCFLRLTLFHIFWQMLAYDLDSIWRELLKKRVSIKYCNLESGEI